MGDDRKFLFRSEPTPPEIHTAESVIDAGLRATYEHWLRLKGARAMPTRAEVVPRDLKHSLRCVHIYDVVNHGEDFRARLVGTGVYPGLDDDQTGKLVSEHPDPGVRLRFGLVMQRVVATGLPLRSLSMRRTGSLLHDARTEGLWLPLGEAGQVEQILAQSNFANLPPEVMRS